MSKLIHSAAHFLSCPQGHGKIVLADGTPQETVCSKEEAFLQLASLLQKGSILPEEKGVLVEQINDSRLPESRGVGLRVLDLIITLEETLGGEDEAECPPRKDTLH